jgi:NDP-sugar pyrophosphorylase family protein
MQAVILAAGKGKRLQPITFRRSKAMAPVLGKPIVERVMDELVAAGIGDFVIVASPDDEELAYYFAQESELRERVRLVHQVERLGMAQALQCAAPLLRGDFVLCACDNLVPAEQIGLLLDRWQSAPQPNAVLALMEVERDEVSKGGVVAVEGPWITRIVEKPRPDEAPSNLYSMALYAFSPRILDYLPLVPRSARGEYELQDAIQMLIQRDGRVCGATVTGRLTLTTPQDLLMINCRYLAAAGSPRLPAPETVGPQSSLIAPLFVESGAVIGPDCTVGPEVYLERDCHIGRGVTLRRAIILRGSVVPDGASIQDEVWGSTQR